jgi:hypothetical protein
MKKAALSGFFFLANFAQLINYFLTTMVPGKLAM